MALRIEDYALIGDCRTCALVGRDGSIDWYCVPRFDSSACFASLLGTPDNGRWHIAPAGEIQAVRRRYRDGTLVLETEFATESGTVVLVDAMAIGAESPTILRLVQGKSGTVPMRLELVIRFDLGATVPWVRRDEMDINTIAGPDMLRFRSPVETYGENLTTVAEFTVAAGQTIPFELAWHPSHETPPPALDVEATLRATERWWSEWSGRCRNGGSYREAVVRSLITLKALTYAPTGGVLAAATTSLPEAIGGVRNWDYRFCWLRDATFTLYALLNAGFHEEAAAWRDWLLRAVAGKPSMLQIMYGLAGERRLSEWEVPWLSGYEGSRPVRIGNAASDQYQLDVYGEVLDVLYLARREGIPPSEDARRMAIAIVEFLESSWNKPDEGIWEVRGGRRQFTHSKVMAWVAFDRAVKGCEQFGMDGPIDRWRQARDAVHAEVCREGFDAAQNTFVQHYGSKDLDASLLMIPLVGFLPPEDPRVIGTVAAIERGLMRDGFIERYRSEASVDGLPPGEGVFLPCTFWLADNLALQGREAEASRLFDHLLTIRNDVGLLSEEYDPAARRLLGNFPQAFTHVSLVNTARNLTRAGGPAEHRPQA